MSGTTAPAPTYDAAALQLAATYAMTRQIIGMRADLAAGLAGLQAAMVVSTSTDLLYGLPVAAAAAAKAS